MVINLSFGKAALCQGINGGKRPLYLWNEMHSGIPVVLCNGFWEGLGVFGRHYAPFDFEDFAVLRVEIEIRHRI